MRRWLIKRYLAFIGQAFEDLSDTDPFMVVLCRLEWFYIDHIARPFMTKALGLTHEEVQATQIEEIFNE